MLTLRFFIVDLCENLKQKFEDLKQKHEGKSGTVVSYRGSQLSPPEIFNLKHNIGTSIITNGFLSTSRSKNVAYSFAKKGAQRPNVETVMLEIRVDVSKVATPLADIAQYSNYPKEEEVLFDLGASFIINSIDYDQAEKCGSLN